jgi:integrase
VKLPKQARPRNVYLSAAQLDMLASEAGRLRSLVLLLGVGGLRWGEAIALRVCDVDFLRRRVEVHRNEVRVRGKFLVGSLNSNENRSVVAALVMTALAATATGTCREHLLWTAQHGGYLRPPG